MDPFEVYQRLKPRILANEHIMGNLALYAFSDPLTLAGGEVTRLGSGSGNLHFSIGRMGNLWLAVREPDAMMHDDTRVACEEYIDNAVKASGTMRTPVICGGIRIELEDYDQIKYAILLENLQRPGSEFIPAESGDETGLLNGRKVAYDFAQSQYVSVSPPINYMAEDKLICIRKPKPSPANQL